jgi:hypothetical protein
MQQRSQTLPTWSGPASSKPKVPVRTITAFISVALLSFAIGIWLGQGMSSKAIPNQGLISMPQDTVHGRFGHVGR